MSPVATQRTRDPSVDQHTICMMGAKVRQRQHRNMGSVAATLFCESERHTPKIERKPPHTNAKCLRGGKYNSFNHSEEKFYKPRGMVLCEKQIVPSSHERCNAAWKHVFALLLVAPFEFRSTEIILPQKLRRLLNYFDGAKYPIAKFYPSKN